MSAAVDLRQALVLAKRNDDVVALSDNLSFGPIDPPDTSLRAKWIEDELGYSDWDEIANDSEKFWAAALADGINPVAWMSRRSAQDYAGCLEFLWRLGDKPCSVVDLTDAMVTYRDKEGRTSRPYLVVSAGLLSAHQIMESNLLDAGKPLTAEARADYCARWQRLRLENAAFRVIGPDLVPTSARIDYFDATLMSHVTQRWQKVARVVGETMVKLSDGDTIHVGDLVLAARVRALAAAGRVESKGDLTRMGFSEIRLPTGTAPASPGAS